MMVAASRCFKGIRHCKAHINAYAAVQNSLAFNSSSVRSFGGRVGGRRSGGYLYTASSDEVVDEFLNQIRAAVEKSHKSSGEICTSCIEKLCREGNLSTAVRLLQSLRDSEIRLDSNVYKLLLAAASDSNDIDTLSQVFKDLFVSCKSLPSTSYFHVAKAFANTDDSVQLLGFVKEISELTFPSGLMAVNRIIYAFGETGQIDKAILIYNHMNDLKCKPDLITYNNILDILGRARRIDEMLHEFVSMKEADIVPDFISYNTLINNLRKVGRLDLCLVYFREMVESGINPDLLTYTALIDVCGRLGNTEESLRLFSEMKVRRIRPSIYIYRLLISNLKKIGKAELATTLMEEMNDSLSDLAGPGDFKRKGDRKGR
ncbi:pentatricopeptide repeat-containing protein At1g11900 isoform X2 [Tripterygium wilfordii]|uniref:pentatricopeptide repeat-containing protein At1g11900 isoform X2 n=1 Tax=Tripterygium wilfordii TaxID=458696 RepID=UPI0018F7F167|nr:pentatricopeptide repeat-containing protein At1g11900 isoform X2 [Tripterygium wilfordii]